MAVLRGVSLLLLLLLLGVATMTSVAAAASTVAPTASVLFAGGVYGNPGCDFSVPVFLGSQGPFYAILDTGSSNIAFATTACSSCSGVTPLYNAGSLSGNVIEISYADNSQIAGPVATASMSVGETAGGASIQASFIAITQQAGFFSCSSDYVGAYEGIIGLAYPVISQGNVDTFLQSAHNSGMPNGFAIQFCSNTGSSKRSGNFWMGGVDTSFAAGGTFQYAKIVNQQYFNVQVNSFVVNGKAVSMSSVGSGASWIVDSGSTDIVFVKSSDYNAVVNAIRTGGFVSFSGSVSQTQIDEFWAGTLAVPAVYVTIHASATLAITFLSDTGGSVTINVTTTNFIQPAFLGGQNQYTFSGLTVSTTLNANILGSAFLMDMTTFFDAGGNRIGFAPAAKCTSVATTSGINLFASGARLVPAVAVLLFAVFAAIVNFAV